MWRTAGREIRQHPSRLVAAGLAIVISVGFIVTCLSFVATESNSIGRRATAKTSSSDVVVQGAADQDGRLQEKIRALPGVGAVTATHEGFTEFASPEGAGALNLTSLPSPAFRWSKLTRGDWPMAADEVAIAATTARAYDVGLGSVLTFTSGSATAARPMRVTGIVDESRSLFGDLQSTAVVHVSYFAGQSGGLDYPTVLIKAQPGVAPETLVDRVRPVVGPDVDVQTAAALTRQTLVDLTNSAMIFRYLLLVFAAIALLVGAMIILNTFSIIVAQRRRQIGLLRAIGASTSQVRRQLVAEAAIIGVLGSGLGVGLGLAVGVAAAAVSGSLADGFRAPVGQVAAAFAAGVLLTWVAALVPARRATKVAPTEALRPVPDLTAGRRAGRLRAVASLLIVLAGAVGIYVALTASAHNVVLAVAASMVLAAGILSGTPTYLPLLLRVVGRLTGRISTVSRLASLNVLRNPSRAAATCMALMLAVGLIVTLQVGAASLKSTTNDTLNAEFPVDVTVTNPSGPLAPLVLAGVAAVPGIKATTPVTMIDAQIDQPGQGVPEVHVAGVRPDADAVVSAGLDELTDRVALVHPFTLEMLGRKSGDRLELTYQGRRATFLLQKSDVADSGTVVVADRELAKLAPAAPVAAVWAAAADRGQAASVIADVRKVIGTQSGVNLAGSLEQSAAINTLLDTLLRVATGLLAVAVAIALIGVGNTLGLSVIERTRESALLRALGLQRRQLRLMLMAEAIVLSLVGSVVGIGAGVLFGAVGVAALVKETSLTALHFSMSIPQTLAVVAVTGVAGALASVLPARRAALAAPTDALAET